MLNVMSQGAVRLRLAEILDERQMTQKQLAEMVGLSENAISKLVGGSPRQIRLDTIDRLATALGVTIEDLFVRES